MATTNRRKFMKALGIAGGATLVGTGTATPNSNKSHTNHKNNGKQNHNCSQPGTDDPFVGMWTASVVPPGNSGHSRTGFNDQTLRLIVHTSIGGSSVRIRLSNTFGDRPVVFDHAEIGIRDEGAAVVPGTNELLTFGGEQDVLIPAGAMAYSDPVPLSVEPGQDLAVSIHAPNATGPATWHPLALLPTYLSGGNDADRISGNPYTKKLFSWYFLEGVDVIPKEDSVGAIVTLGDSITDGFQYQQSPTMDHSYPYYLARRIKNHSDIHRSVLNAGISGNEILHNAGTAGTNALARLNRDVIAQPGVTDVILLEGINDIGADSYEVTAEQIIQGLKQIAIRCHAHGLNIYAGTLTPFGGSHKYYNADYGTPKGEAKREMVNEFIRTGEFFDGVIDFDTAIQDPDQPDRILPKYDSGGHLHPGNAGYRKMAKTIDLSLFQDECHNEQGHHHQNHENSSSHRTVHTPGQ